jgi:hypothetical protein
MHMPLLVMWQYCEPDSTVQYMGGGGGVSGGVGGLHGPTLQLVRPDGDVRSVVPARPVYS